MEWLCPVPPPANGEAQHFKTNCDRDGFAQMQGCRQHYNRDHHDFDGGTPRRIRMYPGNTLKCSGSQCGELFLSLEALDIHVLATKAKYRDTNPDLACPPFDLHPSEPKVRLHYSRTIGPHLYILIPSYTWCMWCAATQRGKSSRWHGRKRCWWGWRGVGISRNPDSWHGGMSWVCAFG